MPSKTMFDHAIEEIWPLSGAFHKCSFGRVKREGNQLANSFSKRTILNLWVEDLPSELNVVLLVDLVYL